MKKITFGISIIFFGLFCGIDAALAQKSAINCDYNAYLFQYNDIYAIDLATGNSYLAASDVTPGNINAAAFNPKDGYMWGSLSSPSKTIVRIGSDFSTETMYIDELPTTNRYVGDINQDGVYYLKGGGTAFYKIDLDPASPNYGQHLSTESLSQSISIHDWAFNAVDGQLYTVEKNTNIIYRINPQTNVVTALGEVPILSGLTYTYGAVYFDFSGNFYVSANQTGTIYIIRNVQNLNGSNAVDSNLFAFGPSSSSNDGARCPTAPVPLEDCTNGIDDDGDGLIDCDDPSCSGVTNCPTLEAPTSGGNDAGLESNNRLSEQISKRQYNRVKTNYKFDKQTAPRINQKSNYAQKTSTFGLSDLIPLNVIGEDYTIETSPNDLIEITNATDLYSVDYMKNNVSVASVLALRTEAGVYEHTKYICDRLLGAELLSVSTIEIQGQPFIKALIKNLDGSVEFVLSLSAKAINTGNDFGIESHWNLDKYEDGIPLFNFQIWSNSIDDLYLLASEVVSLLNVQKPVVDYNLSTPPTVFVKKGQYEAGMLQLEIINTNSSGIINFDAGFRDTETAAFENMSSTIDLSGTYASLVEIQTGNLFDIGFRIGDYIATPDDLFMSDGPWGIDDYQAEIINYEITQNSSVFDSYEFGIERNLQLTASTQSYVSAYRALTPRFKAVDLSAFNSLNFTAAGTGQLEVRVIKASVNSWENQYKAIVLLQESLKDVQLGIDDFYSPTGSPLQLNDVISVVFTMVSEDGSLQTKEMNIREISFQDSNTLNMETFNSAPEIKLVPNPMDDIAALQLTSEKGGETAILIYDQLGRLVARFDTRLKAGANEVSIERQGLKSGIYFCRISEGNRPDQVIRIIMK